jgi:hypothetical protein
MKLVSKERNGSKVIKKYDKATTPYQRILSSDNVLEENKIKLRQEYENINPAELKRQMVNIQDQLMQSVRKRKKYEK